MLQVLIVEDDVHLRTGLTFLLSAEGYDCLAFGSVEAVEKYLLFDNKPLAQVADLCILDRQLPGISGDALCQRLRQAYPLLPILILSARSAPSDRVAGLHAGADDYLCKPFSNDELIARLAVMRRRLAHSEPTTLPLQYHNAELGDCTLCFNGPQRQALPLSAHEYRVLRLLFMRQGQVASRHDLYNAGWGHQHLPNSRALDQMIVGLRAKLDQVTAGGLHIGSVRGVGYRLEPASAKS